MPLETSEPGSSVTICKYLFISPRELLYQPPASFLRPHPLVLTIVAMSMSCPPSRTQSRRTGRREKRWLGLCQASVLEAGKRLSQNDHGRMHTHTQSKPHTTQWTRIDAPSLAKEHDRCSQLARWRLPPSSVANANASHWQ